MKRITVYADFDFLASPQEIGNLGYERVRGKDHFVFEYSHEWLKQHGGIVLSGDLINVPSLQHPRGTDSVFGFVKDSFPDRWGRLLLDRRERLKAQAEGRPVRMLTNYDYLPIPSRFQKIATFCFRSVSTEPPKAVAFISLLLCRCLVLMTVTAAVQAMVIWIS